LITEPPAHDEIVRGPARKIGRREALDGYIFWDGDFDHRLRFREKAQVGVDKYLKNSPRVGLSGIDDVLPR
jgi:hypothetical protein